VVTALTPIGAKRVVVRATMRGRLGATFRLPSQPCGKAFAIRATGVLGSRAVVAVPSSPCVPPPIRWEHSENVDGRGLPRPSW